MNKRSRAMKRFFRMIMPAALIVGALLPIPLVHAVNPTPRTNADYAALPPYVPGAVTPSILMLIHLSANMEQLISGSSAWSETTTYPGLFASMSCYKYNSGNTRYEVSGSAKGSISSACPSSEWDGNFLNWITFRRIDAVKVAMTGGNCVTRLSDGTCSSTSSLFTIKGQDYFVNNSSDVSTVGVVKGNGTNQTQGRVPNNDTSGATTVYFHVRGTGTLAGSFCLDDDNTPPATASGSCTDGDVFTELQRVIRVAVSSQPTGVIQSIGSRARLGLMTAVGGPHKVLVPIGMPQSVPNNSTTVTTSTSNMISMLLGVDSVTAAASTPLDEALYLSMRYIAQLPQPSFVSNYTYPIAFSSSGGVAFQATGIGSLGTSEISALTGSETCPSGYITSACGRDPFLLGSNNTPAWASPSAVASCCKTFIMIFTDGYPAGDAAGNIPAGLQDNAHSIHGTHCTSGSTTVHAPNGTCNTNASAPTSTLLGYLLQEHRADQDSNLHALDDIAYWGHTTDLRPDNGNADPTKACNTGFGSIPNVAVINETGFCLAGKQNVTVYSFFTFGNQAGRELLMQTARQGGFVEQDSSANGPDKVSEYDTVNNYTGALGADGLPDTYFESVDSSDLQSKLLTALASMIQKSTAGISIGGLTTASLGQGAYYQSYFFPTQSKVVGTTISDVTWTGYLQGLFVDSFGNLREDFSAAGCTGAPDGKLVFQHDCIVKIRLATDGSILVDRYQDANGDGVADTTTPFQTVAIQSLSPIWEAGSLLASLTPGSSCAASTGGVTCRLILSGVDTAGAGVIGNGVREFRASDVASFCPWLNGVHVLDCNAGGGAQTTARNEATDSINFIRGTQVSGLRDRQLSASSTNVWKLGDIMHGTPVVVGPPRERFDLIYGDSGYQSFFRRYKDRRRVIYAGANDGMLHAFNGGFYNTGDDGSVSGAKVQAKFTTVPQQPGTTTNCASLPCDGSVPTYSYRANSPALGAELWAYIPQDVLPHLRWLTDPNYSHVYYVDLKPKVADVRIFANDADHPGGWGTVLIFGFRMGGSCKNCTAGSAPPMVVQADFGSGSTTDTGDGALGDRTSYRVFLSAYVVLDVTNPEHDPVYLWFFRDQDLGLSTSAPAIIRVNPSGDAKTSSTNEKWYVVFGTGATHYEGGSGQSGKIFVVDLKNGPTWSHVNKTSGTVRGSSCSIPSPCITADETNVNKQVRIFDTGQTFAFIGDVVTVDFDLDFRTEVAYAGSIICTGNASPCNGSGPKWKGALYRLTTNSGNTDPDTWAVSSGCTGTTTLCPTKVISTFAYTSPQATTCASASPCKVGPLWPAPSPSADDNHNLWLFFGTGRFYSNDDKINTDIQHYFGVKDSFITTGSPAQTTERNNLHNVSSVTLCVSCSPTANVSTDGGATYTSGFNTGGGNLLNNVQNVDGWFTTLPGTGERNLSRAVILGGTVFFTTFIPNADLCDYAGKGLLYALYYLTGTPYTTPALDTSTSGGNTIANRSVTLGSGLPSQVMLFVGGQGTGAAGTGTTGAGCTSRTTVMTQSGRGQVSSICGQPAGIPWSRIVSWRDL